MILIVVKFPVRPEFVDGFLDSVADYTAATRAEAGNQFFEWSRSVDEPNTYVLVEGFVDADAGGAHVVTPHFAAGVEMLSNLVFAVPSIIHVDADSAGWGPMGEITPRG